MLPDTDPRHGTPAGYVAGCRNECCRAPRRRQAKRRAVRVREGVPIWATPDELAAALEPWRRMGFRDAAILQAAGLRSDHVFETNRRTHRRTLDAFLTVTEDSFSPDAKIPADLTRQRIYSLMAAGHRLTDMPINDQGQWRYRDHITVQSASDIRDHFRANEFKIGSSRHTAARARNAGHRPPLAWDDPDTLAWPAGKPPARLATPEPVTDTRPGTDIDEQVVERFLTNDITPGLRATTAEKREIVRRWPETGLSLNELERRTGWNVTRYAARKDVA